MSLTIIKEIDTTPLRRTGSNLKVLQRKDKLYLVPTFAMLFIAFVVRILLFSFWGTVAYNIWNLNFIVFDDMPVVFSLLLTAILLVFSFLLWLLISKNKYKEYFNKKREYLAFMMRV